MYKIYDVPVTAFREKFVVPIQSRNKLEYYHHVYRRVPTIDECEVGDLVCKYEADQQYHRDRRVEDNILKILRQREHDCYFYHIYDEDKAKYCMKLAEEYKAAEANWFGKYGDMGHRADSLSCYMKQKHRMIWERRHGPVGSGRKTVFDQLK